ncbi:glycoside hydrolase family 3 protein [Nocardioides sp. KIGAM211]|uniref:beta-N-acetylhexosaminidase n=1 Tax=Nocardioides luti TaxID=2761101 RepID=A0A7X0RI89_9ACTN|nr:glycoside hydrolase family 3 protein [Nocardioides luti]MBB6628816.1 glycoside hydrolase family 3 protein [Nocardioides luti]
MSSSKSVRTPLSRRAASVVATVVAGVVAGGVLALPAPAGAVPQREWTLPSWTDPVSQVQAAVARKPRRDPAERVRDAMTLPQRVGQLFMVGTPATSVSPATRSQIGRFHVGNVMLTGRSHAGTRTPARVARTLQGRTTQAATHGVRLLVSTDQEGGQVQVLRGPGLTDLPSALVQGTWSLRGLQAAAGRWAGQLVASGVNMNLAPVLDTVPAALGRANPPIGRYDRELGHDPRRVARHGLALVRGLDRHGVAPSVKHFPGLGRVHANTDTHAGVVDRVTSRHGAYLRPFRDAVAAGVPAVMMSSATYTRLDRRNPAVFSRTVITEVLRGDLGFERVVMSDDLGNAAQVARWSAGRRAVKFLRAGGDLVLTVDPGELPGMYAAVLRLARQSPAFRARVDAAALRVLEVKHDRQLLGR